MDSREILRDLLIDIVNSEHMGDVYRAGNKAMRNLGLDPEWDDKTVDTWVRLQRLCEDS